MLPLPWSCTAAEYMHFRYGRAFDCIPRFWGWRLTSDIAVGLPAHCVGVNEVEQAAVCRPADVVMSTVTVYPGVAPLMW